MVQYAKFRSAALIFDPQDPANVPNGAIFMDASNTDAFTTKTTGGDEQQVSGTTQDILTKVKKNMTGTTIPINTSIALFSDGTIKIADADEVGTRIVIGVTLEAIAHEAFGRILLIGPNAADVLIGSGFAPGDTIYMGKTPGTFINSVSSFNLDTDTVVKVGYADCSGGIASPEATDLIMFSEVLSSL
jgi:hypothetical protein